MFEPNFCPKLFADDLKAYNKININNEKNDQAFQKNVNLLLDWTSDWQMKMSINKCGTLLLDNTKNLNNCHPG